MRVFGHKQSSVDLPIGDVCTLALFGKYVLRVGTFPSLHVWVLGVCRLGQEAIARSASHSAVARCYEQRIQTHWSSGMASVARCECAFCSTSSRRMVLTNKTAIFRALVLDQCRFLSKLRCEGNVHGILRRHVSFCFLQLLPCVAAKAVSATPLSARSGLSYAGDSAHAAPP